MNQQTILLALFVVLGVVLVTGLVAIPVIEEAQARSSTADEIIKDSKAILVAEENVKVRAMAIVPAADE